MSKKWGSGQIGTSSDTHGGVRKLPFVFTEQGTAMLTTILRTPVAAEVSVRIMRAFVAMRKYIGNNLIEQKYINNLVLKDNERINMLEETFTKLEEKKKVNHIFYEGQIYDAYSLFIDIVKSAKEEIIIIDNYAGKELFDLIKDVQIQVKVITGNIDEKSYQKYKVQYSNVEIIYSDSFHDCFLILDKKILYTCGASFKDLGRKCFALIKIDDEDILKSLLEKVGK